MTIQKAEILSKDWDIHPVPCNAHHIIGPRTQRKRTVIPGPQEWVKVGHPRNGCLIQHKKKNTRVLN
jgi:hypothetical protein